MIKTSYFVLCKKNEEGDIKHLLLALFFVPYLDQMHYFAETTCKYNMNGGYIWYKFRYDADNKYLNNTVMTAVCCNIWR